MLTDNCSSFDNFSWHANPFALNHRGLIGRLANFSKEPFRLVPCLSHKRQCRRVRKDATILVGKHDRKERLEQELNLELVSQIWALQRLRQYICPVLYKSSRRNGGDSITTNFTRCYYDALGLT